MDKLMGTFCLFLGLFLASITLRFFGGQAILVAYGAAPDFGVVIPSSMLGIAGFSLYLGTKLFLPRKVRFVLLKIYFNGPKEGWPDKYLGMIDTILEESGLSGAHWHPQYPGLAAFPGTEGTKEKLASAIKRLEIKAEIVAEYGEVADLPFPVLPPGSGF